MNTRALVVPRFDRSEEYWVHYFDGRGKWIGSKGQKSYKKALLLARNYRRRINTEAKR